MPPLRTLLLPLCFALGVATCLHAQDLRRLPTPPELLAESAVAEASPLAAAAAPEQPPTAPVADQVDAVLAEGQAPPAEPPPAVDAPADPLTADLIPDSAEEEPVQPVTWYSPSYWLGPEPWDAGIELGLNGSSGSGDSLSTRAGLTLRRKTIRGKLDSKLFHNRTKSEGDETQNNARLDFRYDWLMGEKSPWSIYALNQTFYDRYQAYDFRLNNNLGLAYQFLDTEPVKLGASFGAGAKREFGGVRDEWVAEAQAGAEWEQRVSDTQRFIAKLDYFPEWEDFSSYRLVTDIGWEMDLDCPSNVKLKFSLADQFDSNPSGVNPHLTNYSIVLLWTN